MAGGFVVIDFRKISAMVSELEEQCPIVNSDAKITCPRCGVTEEFMDPLGVAPRYDVWLIPVRKCPNCGNVFALLTDAATKVLSLYGHLA
jgi:predicted RNA-binding Zn-ribbon protein involved in translation (DUF1610 family)